MRTQTSFLHPSITEHVTVLTCPNNGSAQDHQGDGTE